MWKILGNIVEMFVYASVYMIIAMVAMRIVTAGLPPESEKQTSESGIAYALIFASLFIGMALLLSAVIR
ncbi:MAG: hypothetical protein A4E57_00512 [Syntrophorhabdaceae bacterium PtaU1.Bin034]|jgi:hypothetical protein|nr:MAG: hypothetical protein A4E57_00512 [Syntrophorhabdaceae bacterium PtaU1.Bin034]